MPGGLVQPPSGSWSSPFDWAAYLFSNGTQPVDAGLLVATTPRSPVFAPARAASFSQLPPVNAAAFAAASPRPQVSSHAICRCL